MNLNVIGKNRETQEQEIFQLRIDNSRIACLYKDKYGVVVTTGQGKSYRVTQTLEELEEQLWLD